MESGYENTLEEWYAIKFGFKPGKNATETYGMLQTAFQTSCMNWASVFEWHKRFKEGRESVRDDERCERSKEVRTPELIGQIKNFMDKDCHVSIETISAQFDVSVGTVDNYLWGTEDAEDLHKLCPKGAQRRWERKTSSWQQGDGQADQFRFPQFLMLWWPAMKAGSTAMTKRQSSQWKHAGSPRPKKAKQSKSTHKFLMIPFFDSTGII